MPNEWIRNKGPYELNKRQRRMEEKLACSNHKKSQPKFNIIRLIKICAFYALLYACVGIVLLCDGLLVYFFRVPANDPFVRKSPSLSSKPGIYEGNQKVVQCQSNYRDAFTPYTKELDNYVKTFGFNGAFRFKGCNMDGHWGYSSGEPCLLVKLNQAINFKASTYSSVFDLPPDAPQELYSYIYQLPLEERNDRIWLSCIPLTNLTELKAEYVPDRYYDAEGLFEEKNVFLSVLSENLTSDVTFENPAYRRIIGVKFKYVPVNQDIIIRCRAWARNIPIEHASFKFTLRIEGYATYEIPKVGYKLNLDIY